MWIKAFYNGLGVSGRWFMLGDSRWLLLDKVSAHLTKLEAIPEEYLEIIDE